MLSRDLIISLRRFLCVLIVCTVRVLGELLKNEICRGKLDFICKDIIIKTSYLCPLTGKSRGIDILSLFHEIRMFIYRMGKINLRKIKQIYICLVVITKFCLLMSLCCELQTHEHTDFNRPVQFCGSSLLGGVLPS